MGIKNLFQVIQKEAPTSYRTVNIKVFTTKVIACDASNVIYQFLVQTTNQTSSFVSTLTDAEGNSTGHLLGIFNRCINFYKSGVKPVWVFDGKNPELKIEELKKRKKAKQEAKKAGDEAKDLGNVEDALKYKRRDIRVTTQNFEDAKKMLRLMGIPVIEAKGEAEAQCVDLVKKGKAYAVASEDMDCLTFGAPIQLRGFKSQKDPIIEITLKEVLKEIGMDMEEFVDFCILCGCDYVKKIEGIGSITAFNMIKELGSIEKVLERIKEVNEEYMDSKGKNRYGLPEAGRFKYKEAREAFKKCDAFDSNDLEVGFYV